MCEEERARFFMRVGRWKHGAGGDGVDADARRKFNRGGKRELRECGFGGGVNRGLRGMGDALVKEVEDEAFARRGGVEGLHERQRGEGVCSENS